MENELDDCNLSPEELDQFLTPPSLDKWEDFLPVNNPAFITMNASKAKQWKIAKNEIIHAQNQLKAIIGEDKKEPNKKDILLYILGPGSDVGMLLKNELDLSNEDYLKFMSTIGRSQPI